MAAGAVALLLGGATAAGAVSIPNYVAADRPSGLVQNVHSLDDAREKLYRHGYNNIHIERASVPYSFVACKRGVRYHIHINYEGDFEQVDPIGACGGYGFGNGYGNGRRDYDRGDYADRPSYRPRYRPYGFRRYGY